MTPDQAEAAINRLCASFRGRMGKAVREAWADALTDLDADAVTAGIDQLTRTEQRMPSIAAVRLAATAGQPQPARPSTVVWQVLVTWTDPQGLVFAEPRRWHHREADALADYYAACRQAAQRSNGAVELIRYEEGRPARTVEQTG